MTKRQSRLLLAVTNLAGFLAVVVVNALAVVLPLGGKTTAQLSDQYPNLFVPAGLTFSIWGVIYLALALFVAYGLAISLKREQPDRTFVERIGLLFLLTCAANIGWIFSWHYELLALSLVVMLVLLGALIALYVRLAVGQRRTEGSERFLIHLPISLYIGWISMATIANLTALLVAYGWGGFGLSAQVWAVAMIGVGIAVTSLMLFARGDLVFALVVDWATLGIFLKRSVDLSAPSQIVAVASICGMGLITLGIIVQLARRRIYLA